MPQQRGVNAEELKAFLQEAEEQIQLLDEDIVRLEKESDDAELLQEIFRAAHTLKGSSGMIGFQAMARLTHAMEDVLDRVRKRTLGVSPEVVDALLGGLDGLKELRRSFAGGNEAELDVAALVAALEAAAAAEPGPDLKQEAGFTTALPDDPRLKELAAEALQRRLGVFHVRAAISRDSDWAAVRCFQLLRQLAQVGEVIYSFPSADAIQSEEVGSEQHVLIATQATGDAVRRAVEHIDDIDKLSVEPWQLPATEKPNASREDKSATNNDAAIQTEAASPKVGALQTVRIDVQMLDSLMNLVGELVIDRTRIAQISRSLSSRYREDETVGQLATTSTHLAKVLDELNEKMMQARMLPVGLLFNKFPRLVRDLARALSKDVDFVIEGADTEIDRSVIEKIKDPLVHLLRNAVDHGVEAPEEREAAGKPRMARIRLAAYHEQGHIYITVSDDGKGIDASKVRETAVRRGILSPESAERLSEAETLDLIFASGLSTARETTEVSGRGVGMDVVQTSIAELGGLIKVETVLGQGTTFILRLPLTLATFRGLLVSAQGIPYAIPLTYVQETVKLDSSAVQRVFGNEVLNLRGRVMPLVRLGGGSLTGEMADRSTGNFVVVIRSESKLVGLAVDDLLEQQEVVVKPLGGLLSGTRGVAGASILGDGRVALILDITSLMRTSALAGSSPVEGERKAS